MSGWKAGEQLGHQVLLTNAGEEACWKRNLNSQVANVHYTILVVIDICILTSFISSRATIV